MNRRWLSWPRGRHNGRLIEGFQLSFKVHLLYWYWKPRWSWYFGEPFLLWLCFSVRAQLSYTDSEPRWGEVIAGLTLLAIALGIAVWRLA